MAQARASAVDHGRPADAISGALFSWAMVDKDGAAARRTALSRCTAIYDQDFAPIADRYVPAGTPEQVAARYVEYAEAGADKILFTPACPGAEQSAPRWNCSPARSSRRLREKVGT